MKWIVRIYALILLAYTGWRTYDFMTQQLPAGYTSMYLSILFLFATEAGLLLWHEVSMSHSTTLEQQHISTGLTWLDFVGSLSAGIADMIMRQTLITGYQIPPLLITALIYGLPTAVAANVAGALIYLSNDAEKQIDRAKSQLRFEVTRLAIRELRDNSTAIAETLKKQIYHELRDDVTGKIERQYLNRSAPSQLVMPAAIAKPNGNGRVGAVGVQGLHPFNQEAAGIPNPKSAGSAPGADGHTRAA